MDEGQISFLVLPVPETKQPDTITVPVETPSDPLVISPQDLLG